MTNSTFDLTVDAGTIERKFVDDNSSNSYVGRLVPFMIWLFDYHKEYLSDNALVLMERENMKDSSENYKKRSHLKNICHGLILDTPPSGDDEEGHKSPIRIDGVNQISYPIVRNFMMTKRNYKVVDRNVAQDYLRQVNKNIEINENDVMEGNKVRVAVQQSFSQYDGIRSAVGYLYKLARVQQPSKMQKNSVHLLLGLNA